MKKVLFVDDDPNILAGFQRQLRKQFLIETALGPLRLEALKNHHDYAVVVADMRMPEMTGVEFLVQVKAAAPDLVRMMLTGNADQATAVEAVNQGSIFRFLNKPCSNEQLTAALEAGLRQHELITAERELLEHTLSGSLKVLTEILAMVEPKAFGQADALRNRMRSLGRVLKINQSWSSKPRRCSPKLARDAPAGTGFESPPWTSPRAAGTGDDPAHPGRRRRSPGPYSTNR